MAVTIDHPHGLKPLARTRICKLRSFSHFPDPVALELDRANLVRSIKTAAISATTIKRSFSTPCLNSVGRVDEHQDSEDAGHARIEVLAGRGAQGIPALILEATLAMESGGDLLPTPGGLGAAYYLRSDNGTKIAVVKPIDDEPGISKGLARLILGPQGLSRPGQDGETAVREVAAHLLDHGGFAGVPPTALVNISEAAFRSNRSKAPATPPMVASIQRFVPHDYDAGDLGSSCFSVASVHRIGILDVRILNIDRHTGNILVRKQSHSTGFGSYLNDGSAVGGPAELVPIDHGLCLPEFIEDPYFEWLHWPQASVPFTEAECEYISALDPTRDAELLRTELPLLKESSIRALVLSTIFLQRAAAASLCLADIGDMMTREFGGMKEEPSVLETLCAEVKATMGSEFQGEDDTTGLDDCQFEIDFEECDFCSPSPDLSGLLQTQRPPSGKPPRAPPTRGPVRCINGCLREGVLSPLHEEDDDNEGNEEENNNLVHVVKKDDQSQVDARNSSNDRDSGDVDDELKAALPRSMSESVMKRKQEHGGISFQDMNEEEWDSFLERFEKLLPVALESRKNMELNPRLGTSCNF
ncbi:phosphatidylinositol 4-kinase gamma 8-like [Aristolochia californica]|uniref:phosphatidylinositol 4-kinase gamma 8-like n=1 Tax=Aristolochia californica TaxID=171875 RepID=UPI0035D58B14